MGFIDQPRLQVILHVFANTVQVCFDLDPVFLKLRGLANARQHQQLWGVDRPARQDDLLAAGFDVCRAALSL